MKQRRDHIDLVAPFGAAGSVTLPGSKSISNRVLLLAALAEGKTEIHHLLASDDTRYMLDALKALGVPIDEQPAVCTVTGTDGRFATREADLFLGNAGTAIRPLTAVLALASGNYRLSGVARMHERPIGDLVEALCAVGANIRYAEKEGYPPLQIGPAKFDLSTPVQVRGDVSSQFLTALLLALPLTKQDAVIRVDGELVSRPYVEITLNLMARFGVNVTRDGWREFRLAKGSRYRSPGRITVEGDASGASYFLAAGAIGGGPVRVNGVGRDSIQGDVRFSDALVALGAQIDIDNEWIQARVPERGQLKAFDLDLNHIPDAAMTLAVVALFCDGTCKLRNIANWRVKETDRLAAMATELRKLGALVKEGEDSLEITPPDKFTAGACIDTYDDHRIAMCFSLAALSGVAVRINDPNCVAKTYPQYFEHFARLIEAPVIAIDGPSGSGKGTVAKRVAEVLGFHYLDSGALYRLVALHAQRNGAGVDDTSSLVALARDLPVEFRDANIYLAGDCVTDAIRAESVSQAASRVAQIPEVRQALMKRQRDFRRAPGLVAEGRDMASVVFPEAALKVYLTASAEARAERRYKQLIEKGLDANLATLLRDIQQRDARDSGRSVAPLQKSADAQVLETTDLSIDEGVEQVIRWFGNA
jgi:3-phosphoshikimate 1-carboxyvinyltransferase